MPHTYIPLSQPKYRRDIDGLRALAVLSVVAFHAFPKWVKGGFIGVDVFFVISGYLISTILLESMDRGAFSFVQFYGRRIKRIYPALLIMLSVCYIFGWFVLLTSEFRQLAKHIAAGASFISNFVLWNESGYFDNAADRKPLLHLWSLGIEEQFYIVWPLLLWLSRSFKRGYVVAITSVMTFSFALNMVYVRTDGIAAFYSPQTRFWELACGGGLALFVIHESRQTPLKSGLRVALQANLASVIGIVSILFGLSRMDKHTPFPGVWALIPVLGAVLVIYAGEKAWCNRILLGNPVMVWLGLISFPLYLWHWPLLSFARIIQAGNPDRTMRVAAVTLAVSLAWMTYRFAELPLRRGNTRGSTVILLSSGMIIVGAVGFGTLCLNGLPERKVNEINPQVAISAEDGGDEGYLSKPCPVAEHERLLFEFCAEDRRGNIRYALIGDSKAGALFPGLVRTSTQAGRWLVIGGNGPHGPVIPIISSDPSFRTFQPLTELAITTATNDPEITTVVLVTAVRALFQLSSQEKSGQVDSYDYQYLRALNDTTRYDKTYKGLRQAVIELIRADKHVVLVVDNPPLPDPLDCGGRRTSSHLLNEIFGLTSRGAHKDCYLPLAQFSQQAAVYMRMLRVIQAEFPGFVDIFDPTNIYCPSETKICGPSLDGHLLYGYSDHISDYTAGLVGHQLNNYLDRRQTQNPPAKSF